MKNGARSKRRGCLIEFINKEDAEEDMVKLRVPSVSSL
jgi:hypothetical protein